MSLLNACLDTFINLNQPYTKYTDRHLSLLIRSALVGPYALTVEPNNYSVISAQENGALKNCVFQDTCITLQYGLQGFGDVTRATPFVACVSWPPTTVRTPLVLVRGTLWSPNPTTWTGTECSTTVSGPIFFRAIPSGSAMATLEIGPEVLRLVPPSPPPAQRKHRSMVLISCMKYRFGFLWIVKKSRFHQVVFFFLPYQSGSTCPSVCHLSWL